MKKQIALILIMIAMCFVISACEEVARATFTTKYIASERQCVINNVSDRDYNDLRVTLDLEQISNGLRKEIIVNVGDLKKGESYTYNLTEDDIKEMDVEQISINVLKSAYCADPIKGGLIILAFLFLLAIAIDIPRIKNGYFG